MNPLSEIGYKNKLDKTIFPFSLLSAGSQRFWNTGGRGGKDGYFKFEYNKQY